MDMVSATSKHPNFPIVQNSWDNAWVGNLFLGAGYTEADINNGDISCRGSIQSIDLDYDRVVIDDETAWGPNDESMYKMLQERYPGLEMVYRSEEPGCLIYINTDESGEYLPERFIIDAYSDDNYFRPVYEYYNTDTELFTEIADISGVSIAEIKETLKGTTVKDFDWTTWIRKIKNIPDDADCYFGVHEYVLT